MKQGYKILYKLKYWVKKVSNLPTKFTESTS